MHPGPRGLEAKERRREQAEFHRTVLKRAGYRCESCGRTQEQLKDVGEWLVADHIIPLSLGGGSTPDNGRALCTTCDRLFSTHPGRGA